MTRRCKKSDLAPFRIFQLDVAAFGQDPEMAHGIWRDDERFRRELRPLYIEESRKLKARFSASAKRDIIEFSWANRLSFTYVHEKYFLISPTVRWAESDAILNNTDPQDYLFS